MFKSFMSTATNKIALSGLARRDAEVLQGIVALMSMGASVYVLKEKLAGREPDLSFDNLVLQGLTRSGVAGLMVDSALTLSPWTDGASRYASGNLLSVFGGPTPTFLQNAYRSTVQAANPEEDFNAKQALRLLPMQNLFYLRYIASKLEDNTNTDKKEK